jgi:hypothetical protein
MKIGSSINYIKAIYKDLRKLLIKMIHINLIELLNKNHQKTK